MRIISSVLAAVSLALTVAASAGAQNGQAASADARTAKLTFKHHIDPTGIWPKVTLSSDGTTLYMIGDVYSGSYFKFAKLLRASPKVKNVWLGSIGGAVLDGLLIGNLIKKHKLNTHVGHVCASSCTMIFLAGKQRTLAPGAKLGFHQSYLVAETGEIVTKNNWGFGNDSDRAKADGIGWLYSGDSNAVLRAAYQRAALSQKFIERVFEVPPEDMWYPNNVELLREMAATGITDGETLAAPADGMTRAAAEAQLAGYPIWAGFQKTAPDIFDDAAEEYWRAANVGQPMDATRLMLRNAAVERFLPRAANAPDVLIDQYARLAGEMATAQRAIDYRTCAPRVSINPEMPSSEEQALIDREDAVLAQIMASPDKIEKPLTQAKAGKDIKKLGRKIMMTGFIGTNDESDPQSSCRTGLQAIEAMAMLKPKDRVKAFRASLALSALENAQ